MRAWLRISVLGESTDPYILGNGPSKDHKTVISFWTWIPFHLRLLMCLSLTTVAERAKDIFLLVGTRVADLPPLVPGNGLGWVGLDGYGCVRSGPMGQVRAGW